MADASPLLVPSPDKGGALGVRSATSPRKKGTSYRNEH